jgi:hypothetical protein
VEYSTPTWPDGIAPPVICKAGVDAATARVNCCLAVCAGVDESVTCTANEEFPACVGVPASWPVDAERFNPVGNEPDATAHVYGAVPPVASNVAEYGVCVFAEGTELLVISNDAVAEEPCTTTPAHPASRKAAAKMKSWRAKLADLPRPHVKGPLFNLVIGRALQCDGNSRRCCFPTGSGCGFGMRARTVLHPVPWFIPPNTSPIFLGD